MYNIEDRPTDRPADRPTDLAFCKISNGHISATGQPIHFMFGSKVSFRGRRIEWTYFRLYQIQDSAARHLGEFRMTIYLEWSDALALRDLMNRD